MLTQCPWPYWQSDPEPVAPSSIFEEWLLVGDPTLLRSSFAPSRLGVRSSVLGKAGEGRIGEPRSEPAIMDPAHVLKTG